MADIEITDVNFSYQKGREVLHQISLRVERGRSVGIIGANGAGKSTLLKLPVGLLDGYEGTIRAAGQAVEKKNLAQIRKKVGYVFQNPDSQLFLPTLYEDVAFGPRNYGYPEEQVRQKVMEVLERVRMEHLKDRQIYRMSGGQKKLASIASVLSLDPEIILLDEPTIALDPKNRRNIIEMLNGMTETKVIASHDLNLILDTCEETVLLAEGSVICRGKTEELLTDPELLEAYDMELPLCMQGGRSRFRG